MGNGCLSTSSSPEDKTKSKKSRELDLFLKEFGRVIQEEIKLLLLGPGESGKSTIFKQMKIMQIGGIRKEIFKQPIFSNCVTQIQVIISSAAQLNLQYDEEVKKIADHLNTKVSADGGQWNEEIANQIKTIWDDPVSKQVYANRDSEYQLNDSAIYFFDNIQRIGSKDYIPTDQDILRVRVRTIGIEEAKFEFDGLEFKMVDVGGQRSERRKWIHCFENVTAVLFCSALSEYDQTLREDSRQNRMKESLQLFNEIVNSQWFRTTAFILLLNKTDLFKEKIAKIPLNQCFTSYKENEKGANTYEAGSEYIKSRFLEQKAKDNPLKIYTHFTCAISTENIKIVFTCVKETLLNEILNMLVF